MNFYFHPSVGLACSLHECRRSETAFEVWYSELYCITQVSLTSVCTYVVINFTEWNGQLIPAWRLAALFDFHFQASSAYTLMKISVSLPLPSFFFFKIFLICNLEQLYVAYEWPALLFNKYLTTVTGSGNKIKIKHIWFLSFMEIHSLLEELDINQIVTNI